MHAEIRGSVDTRGKAGRGASGFARVAGVPSVDPLVERMRGFGTTIFAEMSALALRTGSVNLGQGFPDTDGPASLLEAAADGDPHRPQPVPARPGHPRTARRRSRPTSSATTASSSTPTPRSSSPPVRPRRSPRRCSRWPAPATRSSSSSRTTTPMPRASRSAAPPAGRSRCNRADAGWTFDPAELDAAITPRCKAILLNTPHNPTGKVFTPAELQTIADAAHPARSARRRRRGVRAPHLRRTAPRADRDPARHARAHRDDLQRRQDVQRDRLEDRLGCARAAAADRGAHGQAVPHLRQRRAVPARCRGRARRRPRCAVDAARAAARSALRRPRRARLRRDPSAGDLLRDRRRRYATQWSSAATAARAPASSRSRAASSTTRLPGIRSSASRSASVPRSCRARSPGSRALRGNRTRCPVRRICHDRRDGPPCAHDP